MKTILEPFVAKYMEDNDCDLEIACNHLGINYADAFILVEDDEDYDKQQY